MTVAARGRAAAPLLALEQTTTHPLTLQLLDALRVEGWRVSGRDVGRAILTHPDRGSIEVQIDTANPDRLVPFIDGRQMPTRRAVDFASGRA